MPTIGAFISSNQPGYLSDRVNSPLLSQVGTQDQGFSQADREAQTQRLFNLQYNEHRGEGTLGRIVKDSLAASINLVDDVVGNKLIPGTQEGDVWGLVEQYGGPAGRWLNSHYQTHQAEVEAISGITGAIATGYVAGAVILPKIAQGLASSTTITSTRLWRAGESVNAMTRTRMLEAQAEAASKAEAFVMLRSVAGRKYLGLEAAKLGGVGLFEEAAIATVLNSNQLVWTDDMSENLLYAGLGVSLGATLGAVSARAEMRRIANSDELNQIRREAIDPHGLMTLRENQPALDVVRTLASTGVRGKESTIFTSLMLQARQNVDPSVPADLQSRFKTLATASEDQAKKSFQKISTKGITGVTNTRFSVDTPAGRHVMESAHNDPSVLYGLDSAGVVGKVDTAAHKAIGAVDDVPSNPLISEARTAFKSLKSKDTISLENLKDSLKRKYTPGDHAVLRSELDRLLTRYKERDRIKSRNALNNTPLGAVLLARADHIEDLKASKIVPNIKEARRLEKQQPLVLIDGHWMPAQSKHAQELSDYRPGMVTLKQTVKGQQEYRAVLDTGKEITLNETFAPRFGKSIAKMHELGMNEVQQVIESQDKVMTAMLRSRTDHLIDPAKADWFQIDSALQFQKRGGRLVFPKGTTPMSPEQLQLVSLKKKAAILKESDAAGNYWTRLSLNLPLPNTLERMYDPAGDMFKTILEQAENGADLSQIAQSYKTLRSMNAFDVKQAPIDLSGNLFNFNRSESGEWKQMVIGFFDSEQRMNPLNADRLSEMLAEVKAERYIHLTSGDENVGFVGRLTKKLYSDPEFQRSMDLLGLSDDQITGVGARGKQLMGEFVTREMRYRDNPIMQSALRIRESTNRASDEHLTELVQVFGDVIPRLNAAPAGSSKVLVNQFLSNASGWDLLKQPADLGDGFWGFGLAKSQQNAARLGREVTKGELLVNPRTGKPIVVDELGLDFLDRLSAITSDIRIDKNRIREAMGLSKLNDRPWYVPPPDLKNKYVAFTLDSLNQPVPGGTIIADTQSELQSLIAKRNADLPAGHVILSRDAIRRNVDLYDKAAMDWIDPGAIPAPGKSQRGTLAADTVNPHAVQDTLTWIQRQVESIGTGTMRTLYDSQLSIARARGAVEADVRGLGKSPVRTIWDEYEYTILGKTLGDPEKSVSGRVMRPIEEFIDGGLETVWPAMSWASPTQAKYWLSDLFHRMGVRTPSSFKTYNELATQLSNYTPYKNAVDFAEQNRLAIRPPEVKAMAQSMNKLATLTLLRAFEIAHPAMNLLGLITTMPSILKAGRAPLSMTIEGGGKRVSVVDPIRIMAGATKDMLNKTKHADWDIMVRNGDTTQQVAEFHKQYNMIQDRSTFMQVMQGDSSIKLPTNARDNFKSPAAIQQYLKAKGVEGLVSLATDTSENWSRTFAHFAGLRLADMQGIIGTEARHSFARDVANAAIANYNPMNRPEMFQSAFGSMAGLFMSWMQSYNQRLFRWIENGQYALVGQQLGMQSALFGVASMPGYNPLSRMLLATGANDVDGQEATITDHIYARFGPELGTVIAHGGLSALDVVLYTRGDMNYRSPTLDPSKLAASLGIGKSLIQGMYEVGQTLTSQYSINESGRLGEVLARHMPNRVLKSWMNIVLNDGNEVDARGQLISQNKDFFETSVRMLGLRTQRQQAEVEAFYTNRQLQDREAARMDVLREETRALLRTSPENIDEHLMDVFDKYIEVGGTPNHFRQWLLDNIRSSTMTRGLNEIRRSLNSPKNQMKIWRYEAYGAQ